MPKRGISNGEVGFCMSEKKDLRRGESILNSPHATSKCFRPALPPRALVFSHFRLCLHRMSEDFSLDASDEEVPAPTTPPAEPPAEIPQKTPKMVRPGVASEQPQQNGCCSFPGSSPWREMKCGALFVSHLCLSERAPQRKIISKVQSIWQTKKERKGW